MAYGRLLIPWLRGHRDRLRAQLERTPRWRLIRRHLLKRELANTVIRLEMWLSISGDPNERTPP